MIGNVEFEEELAKLLPHDIPGRECLVKKGAQHLRLVASANEYMNLTRISSPHEAAIKHIYDCVAPWHHFQNARRVLDVGTGAGFPGIPLAVVLPEVRFLLSESTGKKARFVDSAIDQLEISNAEVTSERAESVAMNQQFDIITARAVAPISRILDLFGKPLKKGVKLVLYKGPDVDGELHEATSHGVQAELLCRYELPLGLGSRSLIGISANGARSGSTRKQAAASRR